jgi:hypothetical protein
MDIGKKILKNSIFYQKEFKMKKLALFLSLLLIPVSVFAGGGGYFDDQFPRFTHVTLDLTEKYRDDFKKRDFYTIFECEAEIPDTGRKIEVPAGTQLRILSITKDLKFCHDFDRDEYNNTIHGIVYYDYLCEFKVKGTAYTGLVPGFCVSTEVQSITVNDGTTYKLLGINLATNYYKEAIDRLEVYRKDYELFVFSDDLYWCNQHASELGLQRAPKLTYVSGNFGQESYVDLQLMTGCKGIIMANSAFSYLAGLLNRDLDFCAGPDRTDLGEGVSEL